MKSGAFFRDAQASRSPSRRHARGFSIVAMAFMTVAISGCERSSTSDSVKTATAARGDDLPLPNVIWILLDACRADSLAHAGNAPSPSPNLDRLAAGGAKFTNHFTQGLWTEISVPSYMTGRYFPVACLDVGRVYPPREIPVGEVLLPELARQNGLRTACFSAHAWITPVSRLARSFDEFHVIPAPDGSGRPAANFDELNAAAIPWIRKNAKSRFFLYLHALDTHFPHNLLAPHDRWIDRQQNTDNIVNGMPVRNFGLSFSEQEKSYLRGLRTGAVSQADEGIGAFLEELRKLGLLDNTVVVVSADHGDALGEDGTNWGHWLGSDEVMHVPLVIAGPGVPPGITVDALTENVDIVPTLVELLGLDGAIEPDGKSLVELFASPSSHEFRNWTLTKYFHVEYDGAPGFLLRSRNFKYELNTGTGAEHLWRVPDNAASRSDALLDEPVVLAEFRQLLGNVVNPMLKEYQDLQKSCLDIPITRDILAQNPENLNAISFASPGTSARIANSDGLWSFADGELWTSGWTEDVSPVHLELRVPPGEYIVQLHLFGDHDLEGSPASSVAVFSDDMTEATTISCTQPEIASAFQFKTVGTFEITDGQFQLSIDNGDSQFWTGLRAIRFVPPYTEAEVSPLELRERTEQLRALGYVE